MRVVAVTNQKGGVGKTTLTINLAVEAGRVGDRALVLDLDPQATSLSWRDWRGEGPPEVEPAQYTRLGKAIGEAREAGWFATVFIDTPPTVSPIAEAAVRVADLVLIPALPTPLDLDAAMATAALARRWEKPGWVVLNGVRPRSALVGAAEAFLAGNGIGLCPVQVGYRAAFQNAVASGRTGPEWEPRGGAAEEIAGLYGWIAGVVPVGKGRKR